jgi:hypothetical protein
MANVANKGRKKGNIGMDERTARELTRLHRIDLRAQLHFSRGRERGSMHWMAHAVRAQLIANAGLIEIVAGGAHALATEDTKAAKRAQHQPCGPGERDRSK